MTGCLVEVIKKGDIKRFKDNYESETRDPWYLRVLKIFGKEHYKLVELHEVRAFLDHHRSEVKVFRYDDKGHVYETKESLLDCFFLIDHWDSSEFYNIEKINKDIDSILLSFDQAKEKKQIRGYMNSRKATKAEDKLEILKFKKIAPVAPTFHFKETSKLKDFLQKNEKSYIIKPRHGCESVGVKLIRDLKILPEDIENYIVQEEINHAAESRLIFFDGKFVSASTMKTSLPWNEEKKMTEQDDVELYHPTKEELDDSLRIVREADMTLGAVDWMFTASGKRYLLEINGIGTFLGSKERVYNLNEFIAIKIKEKYFPELI